MTVEITDVADTAPRRAIASFDPYEDAQALLDRLADGGFPVERLAILGRDLEIVERVTDRLDAGRAALAGSASGRLGVRSVRVALRSVVHARQRVAGRHPPLLVRDGDAHRGGL